MDGVLADVVQQFIRYHERDFGVRKTIGEINGHSDFIAFPKGREYVFTPGFFREAPVMEGSREVLEQLNKKYDLFIVSAATEFPQSLSEKQEWLNEHFPFIQWQQMVFCGSKSIIQADVMIDDHFRNLDPFAGTTLLYSQPHNATQPDGRHRRVHTWAEVATLLL